MATKTRELADFILEEGIGGDADLATQSVPHIQPGTLYPAVANIMVDGSTALSAVTTGPNSSTVASSKYGTVQSDGRMYYYTDIKGSKPIKDPRIGAYFGSQRHLVKSRQLLEQETATHGSNIYSADGREWIRMIWSNTAEFYTSMGHMWRMTGTTESIEVVGYFTSINILTKAEDGANRSMYKVHLNGSVVSAITDSSNPTTIT